MWQSIQAIIPIAISLLTLVATVVQWFAARAARKERALTETLPQLEETVFGPRGPTGRSERAGGLEARVEVLEQRAKRNAKRIERTQNFLVEVLRNAAPGGDYKPEDTGRYRALVAKLSDLDEPDGSDPPDR